VCEGISTGMSSALVLLCLFRYQGFFRPDTNVLCTSLHSVLMLLHGGCVGGFPSHPVQRRPLVPGAQRAEQVNIVLGNDRLVAAVVAGGRVGGSGGSGDRGEPRPRHGRGCFLF
jgi:hypothetical protein